MSTATQTRSAARRRLALILDQTERDRTRLDGGAFGTLGLTALGIAAVVGAGIFVSTGVAASQDAGPAVVISFLLAGLVAAATALCYAELAAMIPAAGSTYSYAFVSFGVFAAWLIGWDLLLEYLFAAATVAVGWGGYVESALAPLGIHVPDSPINLPAMFIVACCTILLIRGARESARVNAAIVVLKLCVLALVIGVGALHVTTSNWSPFVPHQFGAGGVLTGAGVLFFAFVGFDSVSTAAAEARNPARTVPRALIITVVVATVLYMAVGLVLTGLVPYTSLNVSDPISQALREVGPLSWLDDAVNAAAIIGLFSTVLVTLYGQTRILMRMSADGLLPPVFNRVDPRRGTPVRNTLLCGAAASAVAAVAPIDVLGNLVSIGTLFAFVLVCSGVLVMRRTLPEAERPVRIPHIGWVAGFGLVGALALMSTLSVATWVRLVTWMAIGLVIYRQYGRARALTGEHGRRLSAVAAD